MDFVLWAGFVAGFAATVVMSVMIMMAKAAGMTEMPPFPIMTGSMVSGDKRTATIVGTFIHYMMMGTIIFGLLYALLFAGFDSADWWLGVTIGVVHGLVIGVMAMPMMPAMHPRMTRAAVIAEPPREIQLNAPGLMGKNWGAMTPLGVLMGHAVYGVVHALVYSALV